MTTSTEPANIHFASKESIHYLEQFSLAYNDDDTILRSLQHPARVADTVAAFAGDFVPHRLYDVALLHDVVDRFENSTDSHIQGNAKTALHEYFREIPQKDAKYVSSVMADLAISEQVAEGFRNTEALHALNSQTGILQPGFTGKVSEEFWRLKAPSPNIEAMAELAKMTNIETPVIRAAEKIDNLWLPPKRDAALFLDVIEIEYFDVPQLEIVGFDGMGMAGRDVSMRTRHEKLGNDASLEKATKLHEDARKMSVPQMLELIVGEGNFTLQHVVIDMAREPFVEIGDFDFKDPNDKDATGKFRIKTIGSIADKIERYGEGNIPMDIFATTIIEEDVAASAEMFASMIEQLSKNNAVTPIPAKSKEKAYYVQGDDKYLKRVANALEGKGIDLSEVQFQSIDSKGYEVSKITFNLCHDGVITPSELQIVTNAKRFEARLGSNGHYALKSGESDVDLELIESIYDRKSRMTHDPDSPNYLEVNGQSVERGRNLLERITA